VNIPIEITRRLSESEKIAQRHNVSQTNDEAAQRKVEVAASLETESRRRESASYMKILHCLANEIYLELLG